MRDAAEDLAELLDERDAGAHERVDRAARDVDGVGHEVALERELDRAGDGHARLLLRLRGRGAEVRRDDRARLTRDVIVGRRLLREHVDAGSGDLAGFERRGESLLVDEAAAGDVDDVRGLLHGLQLSLADHAGRLGRLRHVDRQEVGLGDQFVERDELSAELLGARGRDVRVEGDHAHAEGLHASGDERADAAEADHAERLLEELRAGERAALPCPARQRGVGGRDVAREADDVSARELGGRDDVRGRRVDDHDARGRGGFDIDVVEADTGPRDDLEVRRMRDRFLIHLRRRADENSVRIGERREQRRTVGSIDRSDIEVGPEGIDGGGGKLLCEKDDGLRQSGSLETALHTGTAAHTAPPCAPA